MVAFRTAASRLASGAPLILLGTSVVLTAVLAWQAFASAASHRALAERVLHDYAQLAAIEFSRRSTAFIGNYGVVVGLRALSQATRDNGGTLPAREAVAAAMPAQSRRARELIGTMFQFDARGASFGAGTDQLTAQARQALLDATRGAQLNGAGFVAVHPVIDERTRLYVLAPVVSEEIAGPWLGFEVSLDAVRAWIEEFVAEEPLLPAPLAASDAARSALRIVMRSPDGRILYRLPATDTNELSPLVVRDLAGTPAVSGLNGFMLEVALDPSTASSLIIGGLPRSQLGFVLALLVLSVALAAAAAVQMRKERRLAEIRQDFVTRASHELRTPVARIRMFTETLMLDRVRSEDERRQTLHALDRGARRLSLLIDNVLQLARARSAAATHREQIDVVTLVSETARDFESSVAASSPIEISSPPAMHANVDAEALRQVLLNLLDNAWKYGGDPPSIRVSIELAGEELAISVEDNGPGIPQRDRTRIWEPYVRLERDRRSSISGTGIGLAVVKDLVIRHGGALRVEDAPSGGARFVVTLAVHGGAMPQPN